MRADREAGIGHKMHLGGEHGLTMIARGQTETKNRQTLDNIYFCFFFFIFSFDIGSTKMCIERVGDLFSDGNFSAVIIRTNKLILVLFLFFFWHR